jgi:hypothetical protein
MAWPFYRGQNKQDVPKENIPDQITIYRLGMDLFREIDVDGTNQPILLVHVDTPPQWSDRDWSGSDKCGRGDPVGCRFRGESCGGVEGSSSSVSP